MLFFVEKHEKTNQNFCVENATKSQLEPNISVIFMGFLYLHYFQPLYFQSLFLNL